MREMQVDIWSYQGQAIIAITTNGSITRDGRAIMGKGVARQAAERFPELRHQLGRLLQIRGNHVHEIMLGLVSFPVEETPYSLPELRLIRRSAEELRLLADQCGWTQVLVPRPGCGGGGMRWQEVKPLLEEFFDDRFIVVSAPEHEK
ncbi:ADP-ribose-binding protein [Trichlorobacter lovleyi]|uniref:ADP-ribose-binding protein n=1 Tax=Trichlorobacter lovleyi TaxID=313985 RepID=UPI002240C498|nr:ADP-ribose-binding protein [Trichlorobacter lovleyi]QOX77652.1 ADP-ribose-binding protein [Trichlorobacter lovleyi]